MSAYETLRSVTRRSTFLVFVGASALLGFAYQSRVLLALFEASVVFLLLSWFYVYSVARRISLRREVIPRAYEGDELEVTLYISNASLLPGYLVEVEDWFPTDPTPAKSILVAELPGRAREGRLRYRASCDRGRGRFTVGPVKVTVTDPLGFFRRTLTLPVYGELVVFPRTFPIGDLGLRFLQSSVQISASTPQRAGQTPLFWGTREYEPGDNPRHIHWRMSARWDALILKQFESPSNVDITCFLDLHRDTLRGVGRSSNVEQAIRVAASVAEHAAARDHPFQLVADGEEAVVLRPGTGTAHLIECLDALARARPVGGVPYADLLRRGGQLLAPGSVAVLIFNGLGFDREAVFAVAADWRRRRIGGLAVLVDERTFLALEGVREVPEEGRMAAAEDFFRELGYGVVALRSGDDLARAFAAPEAVRV